MSEELSAAETALHKECGGAVEFGAATKLSSGERSTVYRVPVIGADAPTVIVKAYRDNVRQWENEAVAFTVAAGLPGAPLGPELLAADRTHHLLVISDLGDHPALSDALLGTDRRAAEAALVDWASALGRFAALTRDARSLEQRTRESGGYGPPGKTIEFYLRWAGEESLSTLAGRRFGVTPPAGLEGELAAIERLLEPSEYDIFSPGDACPDNNLITPDGVRFVDFEFSGAYSLFLDAAYAATPFPTCWCVLDMSYDMSRRTVSAYRTQVVQAFPELAEDERWQDGLARACALWTVIKLRGLLRHTGLGDRTSGAWDHDAVRFPGHIAECHFRITRFLEIAGTSLPAITEYLSRIRDRIVSEYGDITMPRYPAFRK